MITPELPLKLDPTSGVLTDRRGRPLTQAEAAWLHSLTGRVALLEKALSATPAIHNSQTCADPSGFRPERCTCHIKLRWQAGIQ